MKLMIQTLSERYVRGMNRDTAIKVGPGFWKRLSRVLNLDSIEEVEQENIITGSMIWWG